MRGARRHAVGTEEAALPDVVNIGTQQMPNDEGIAKAKKYLEEEMGVTVNLVEFDSGKSVNNALASKSIDFGLMGSSPAALAIASDIPVEMIWIHEVLGTVESLAIKNGSGIEKMEDLKGKKIATPFASTAHYSLLNALEINGIKESEVTLVDMQPNNIYAAWQRGDIEAAYVWDPTLSELLKDGKILISSEDMAEEGVVTANVEVVRTEFAQKYPELVAKYIKAMDKAVKLFKDDQDDAVATIAEALNLTEEESLKQMTGSIWLTASEQLDAKYMGTSADKGAFAEYLKSTANFLVTQKNIASAPELPAFETALNPSYIEAAVK